jgi:DmsE family decaheme c-type cytochrome
MDRKKLSKAIRWTWPLVLGLAVLAAWPTGALSQSPNDFVGTETCLECHDGMASSFQNSVHGRLPAYQYPGLAEGCEACHGPGAKHADSNEIADIFIPTAEMGNNGAENCLACHKTGHTLDWELSEHASSDVACLSCHQIHGSGQPALLAAKQEELCFGCHADMKSKFRLPSHHPLKEGFMACTSCHDVHGDRFQVIADGETNRDACLACHNEHAGPFIFEHSPVMEDCSICHDPHGTVANNLLHQNEPFLCLQCHQPHFHSILNGAEGDYGVPGAVSGADPSLGGLSGTSHGDSMKRVMLTKCTQCHQSIHGTDLPSQSITGQGRALNR